jgi:hypothetical protein
MQANIISDEIPVRFISKFREYGIEVLDGGSSHIVLEFCPWCGSTLPPSLRDRWHEELEKLGIDIDDSDAVIPEPFRDERWFVQKAI